MGCKYHLVLMDLGEKKSYKGTLKYIDFDDNVYSLTILLIKYRNIPIRSDI